MGEKSEARWMLVLLAGDGMEATGELLSRFWTRLSRRGRLDAELRRIEHAGKIAHSGAGSVDARTFHLTAAGRKAITGPIDPEALWSRPWDGRWRVVLFDVPQSRAVLRTRLRRRLKDLRCGWLQNSVWLSPEPVESLTEQLRHERVSAESLVFFEGRPAGGESDAELVAAAWDFEALGKLHASYLRLLQLRPDAKGRAGLTEWIEWLRSEDHAWREIARRDPFLPSALLPAEYAGRAIWKARLEALNSAGFAMARSLERG